ncbi:MAG: hypothetical protein HC886_16900 [Leptolyngbyaceae cyanobacterium SM1_1_3]|nr:hypothetical protein [Leptolyngbyaceae cyanobacterium SM1_1_3]
MYTADFNITNDWGTGFTGEIVITNLGNESIEWSRLEFDAPLPLLISGMVNF